MFSLYIEKFIIFCVIMPEFWFFMVCIRSSPRDTAAILLVEKAPVFFLRFSPYSIFVVSLGL